VTERHFAPPAARPWARTRVQKAHGGVGQDGGGCAAADERRVLPGSRPDRWVSADTPDQRAYAVPVPVSAKVSHMARPPGIPQKQPVPRVAVSNGNREKFYGYVLPELCDKARTAAAAANLSLGGYLERLIAADQVDEDGRPLWAGEPDAPDEQLRLVG
jgi:hypothetical protein